MKLRLGSFIAQRVGIFRRFSQVKVTTEQIRLLRDSTGAPLTACKSVLVECAGDMEKAKSVLREKNLVFADKKIGAESNEGVKLILT